MVEGSKSEKSKGDRPGEAERIHAMERTTDFFSYFDGKPYFKCFG